MTPQEKVLKTRAVLRQFRKDYGECCNLLAMRTLERDRLREDNNRLRHAVGQLGFWLAGKPDTKAVCDRTIAVLKGEPINPLYDPRQTY